MPTLTLTPNPIAPGKNLRVDGAGFDPGRKVQLALDGSGWTTNYLRPAADGTFHEGMNVATSPRTQKVTARYADAPKVIVATAAIVVAPSVPVPPDPVPVPPGRVVGFPLGSSADALVNLAKDLTVGIIEWAGGTYPRWSCFPDVARPADKPLLIRPAAGADILLDGTGTDNAPPFRIGWRSLASYITIDPAGTGGSFTIQNYAIGAAGLVMSRYIDHVAVNGITVRNCYGTAAPQVSHVVYVGSSNEVAAGLPRSRYWTSNDWDVVGPSNRNLSCFQTEHSPNADHVEARRWKVRSLHRAAYVYADPTDVVIDGWDIADCNATIDNWGGSAQGVVSNCRAVNSGPMAPGQGSWKVGPLTGVNNTAS